MKNMMKIAILALAAVCLTTACDQKKDGKENFKSIVENKDARPVTMGDFVFGEVVIKFNDDQMADNTGNPTLLFQVTESMYKGDVNECLMMMHEGDHAVITVECDSMAKYFGPNMLPPKYVQGQDMTMTFDITISKVKNMQEMMQEEEEKRMGETARIEKYVQAKGITAKPTPEGLYVIVNKKGNGTKVGPGKTAMVNYTGRLLNGKMFDSSIEADAKEGGIFNPNRPYGPIEYNVDKGGLIEGWIMALDGQPAGTQMTLIIPSSLAYKDHGSGADIGPYEPLTFDLEIVEVK